MARLFNTLLFMTVASVLILSSFSIPVDGEEYIDLSVLVEVTIGNDLEWDIYSFYMSPSDSEYYAGELLGSSEVYYLGSGEEMVLYMVPGDYDVLLFDEDYDLWTGTYSIADSGSGLSRGGSMYLSFNEVELFYEEYGLYDETYELEIEVNTEAGVEYLFFSPSDSDSWGIDHLGEVSLESGDYYYLTYMPSDPVADYDLLIVFDDSSQMHMEFEGSGDDSITLVDIPDDDPVDDDDDTPVDDDDDTPVDDDDDTPVDDDDDTTTDDDDDDTPVDDDDDTTTDDDDDELPLDQQPGGVGGNKDDPVEGESEEKSTNGPGIIAMILCLLGVGTFVRIFRKK